MEKRESWLQRAWKDPVWSKVIANAIWAVPTGVFFSVPSVRQWAGEDLERVARLEVIGWFALGISIGVLGSYGIAQLLRSSQPKQPPASSAPTVTARPPPQKLKPLPFKDVVVRDEFLNLEWRIKRDPATWADDHELGESTTQWRQALLAGPYHLAKGCGNELREFWNDSHHGNSVYSECPACKVPTFGREYVPLDTFRKQTLAELQRMHRQGSPLTGTVVLERPPYWHDLKPKKR